MINKPVVLFFARSFYNNFFSNLLSESYHSEFATLTKKEKEFLLKKGLTVCGCFEEEFESLEEAIVPESYLETSWQSDRFFRKKSLEERIIILSKEITFWRNILSHYKPIAVINETVAIEISEVLAIEAKKQNIPYCSFLLGNIIPNTFYWKPNPMNGVLYKSVFDSIREDDESISKAKEYVNNFRRNYTKPKYIQGSLSINRYSIRRLISFLFSDTKQYLRRLYFEWFSKNFKYEVRLEGFQNVNRYLASFFYSYDEVDLLENKNYVVYPLHMEPEATLFYFSEYFSNQVYVIENIAKTLKTNQYLVVKEHPQQFGILLLKRFQGIEKRHSFVNLYKSGSTE